MRPTSTGKLDLGEGDCHSDLARVTADSKLKNNALNPSVLMTSADGGAKSPCQFSVTDEKVGEMVETFLDTQSLIAG